MQGAHYQDQGPESASGETTPSDVSSACFLSGAAYWAICLQIACWACSGGGGAKVACRLAKLLGELSQR